MNRQPALSEQVRQMNKHSLVTYLKLLGHQPSLIHPDYTIFPSPLSDSPQSMLIVDNKTNTFRVTISLKGGKLMDLASLMFRRSPKEILSDIVLFRLDQLMSTENVHPADQP
jgi:hypothetical protein